MSGRDNERLPFLPKMDMIIMLSKAASETANELKRLADQQCATTEELIARGDKVLEALERFNRICEAKRITESLPADAELGGNA